MTADFPDPLLNQPVPTGVEKKEVSTQNEFVVAEARICGDAIAVAVAAAPNVGGDVITFGVCNSVNALTRELPSAVKNLIHMSLIDNPEP